MGRYRRMTVWLVAAGCIVTAGCAAPRFKPDIRQGMTNKQVVDMLGKPDLVSKRGSRFVAYQYSHRKVNGMPLGDNYIVIFKDGRVEANGPGRLRENPSRVGMFVILPFK